MMDRLPVNPAHAPRGRIRPLQRGGVSLSTLVLVAVIVSVLGAIGARIVPAVLEHQAVTKAVNKAAAEALTTEEARAIFDRAAAVESISSIKGRDLDITRGAGERPVLRYAYQREFHLVGPAFLTLKYSGQAGSASSEGAAAKQPQ